jgi:preprotein translocase subunit SecF
MYQIIQKRKIFLVISGIACTISLLALIFWWLKPGIDFAGGAMMEISYNKNVPSTTEIEERLQPLNLGQIDIRPSGENGFLLRFKNIDEQTHQNILVSLNNPEELKFESVGPSIGREVTQKAQWAVILMVIFILIYIAWAFRKLSRIIRKGESWRYGTGAILAMLHDVLIILGLFAILGHFRGTEISATFVVAILTVLGYSVNDTIVIYDRIRENFLIYGSKDFENTVNRSLNEILGRSLTTGFGALLSLLAIFLFGGESTKDFALTMIVGIITGSWSSIAIATPFLLWTHKKS